MRSFNRKLDEIRPINIERGRAKNAEGSCLIKCGNTEVLCMATIEEKVPNWLRGSNSGWVTAEYGMLPRATNTRLRREANSGKQSGRTLEIQRLIGRSLRAVVDLNKLGDRTIIIDCDVLNADGGTRTTSITGAFIALNDAIEHLLSTEKLTKSPIKQHLAAISCGIVKNELMLDLDYSEDSTAETDANFVMTEDGRIVEIQGTAEQEPFSIDELNNLTDLAKKGIDELINMQKLALL